MHLAQTDGAGSVPLASERAADNGDQPVGVELAAARPVRMTTEN